MGYWDEAGADGTGKNRMFKEITVQRALSPKDLDSLPDLYIDRPDDHGYPLTFTGWTANRDLISKFVKNDQSSTGFQGERDNNYDYLNISEPLNVIDERLPNKNQSTDTKQKSIDGSMIDDHYILLYPIYTTGKAYNGSNGEKKFIFRLKSEEQHRYKYTWNGDQNIDSETNKYNYYFEQDWNSYSDNQDPDKYYYYYKNFRVNEGEKYYLDFDVPQFTYDNYGGTWFYLDYKNPNGNGEDGSGYANAPFFSSQADNSAYIQGSGYYNIYVHITWEFPGVIGIGSHSQQNSTAFDQINSTNKALIKNQDFKQKYSVLQGFAHFTAQFYISIKVEKVYDFRLAKASYSNNFSDISTAPSFAPVADGLQNNGDTTGTPLYFKDYYLLNVPVRNEGVNEEIKSDNPNENIWYKSNFFGLASIDYPLTAGSQKITRVGELTGTNLVNKINQYEVFKNFSPAIAFDSNKDFIKGMTATDSSADFQNSFDINKFFATDFSGLDNSYIKTQVHFLLRLNFTPSTSDNTTKLTSFYLKAIPQKRPSHVTYWLFDKNAFNQYKVVDSNGLLDPQATFDNFTKNLEMAYKSEDLTTGQSVRPVEISMTASVGADTNMLAVWRGGSFYDHLEPDVALPVKEGAFVPEKNVVYLF